MRMIPDTPTEQAERAEGVVTLGGPGGRGGESHAFIHSWYHYIERRILIPIHDQLRHRSSYPWQMQPHHLKTRLIGQTAALLITLNR